jgi:hypothetical protein
VDFKHDIAPIVESRCGSCHGEDKDVRLSFTAEYAYEALGRFVDPGRARTSRLIWHLFGRNVARPWDGAAAQQPVKPMPRDSSLTDDERRMFVEWIDLGALWDAVSGASVPAEAASSASKGGER